MTEDTRQPFALAFENLYSGDGDWTIRLCCRPSVKTADNSLDHPLEVSEASGAPRVSGMPVVPVVSDLLVLDEATCLPGEVCKLTVFSGSEVIDCIKHQETYYSLEQVTMHPATRRIDLEVAHRPSLLNPVEDQDKGKDTAKANPVACLEPELIVTSAQEIVSDRLIEKLKSPAHEVLAYLRLNDHLFHTDPARVVFLVGVDQYDEYDYLATMILLGIQRGLHPEYVLRTTFDKMGLGGRYSDESIATTLRAIVSILCHIDEPSPLNDDLLQASPEVFVYSALLRPTLSRVAPQHHIESTDFWNETLELSRRVIAGESSQTAVLTVLRDAGYDMSELEGADARDADDRADDQADLFESRRYLLDAIRLSVASAQIIFKTSTLRKVLNPRPNARSRFDTLEPDSDE